MFQLISVVTILAFYNGLSAAAKNNGYHYEKPFESVAVVSGPSSYGHGHSFGPLPTIKPLPPVPALPPLPTPRSKVQITQTQTLYQTHPASTVRQPVQKVYAATYGAGISKIAQQYKSPRVQTPSTAHSAPSAPAAQTTATGYGFFPSGSSTGIDTKLSQASTASVSTPPSAPASAPAPAPPLRIPFGKQAIITYPTAPTGGEYSYEANGRQLKQYAVVEIIDNDIEQNTQPFLTTPFFDSYRAHVGATGTGAIPLPFNGGGIQLGSRAGSSVLEQQRSAAIGLTNDAVALGSGGLGFIRLSNGNVYFGSGSLGYISGQQHSQSLKEARTRTGASRPDPLHFGHGPLGGSNRFNRFLFKF